MAKRSVGKGSKQGALVSVKCHLWWLDEMINLLDNENAKRLKASCFGHLFDMEDIQFQGQLYHILVKNCLNKESASDGRLSFTIHDKVLDFGPVEYATVCGLRFDGWYEPPTSSKIHREVFRSKRKLKFCDISKAFAAECKATLGRSELCLKLALLYVLYAVVMVRDKNSKNIEMKYLHLADDVEQFNAYAWGRVSYEYMVMVTHSRRGIVDNLQSKKKRMAYDAYGFVLALQCWAYEILPDLGRYCATLASSNEGRFPRIVRWTTTQYFQYDDLIRFFNDGDVVPILPSEEEWEFLQQLGLARSDQVPCKARIEKVKRIKRKVGDEVDAPSKRKCRESIVEAHKSPRLTRGPTPEVMTESSPASIESPFVATEPFEDAGSNVTLQDISSTMKVLLAKIEKIEKYMQQWTMCCVCGGHIHKPSNHSPDKERENGSEHWDGKVDLWKNQSKSSKFNTQDSHVKSEEHNPYEKEGPVGKTKNKEQRKKSEVKDEKNSSDHTPLETERPKKLRKVRQKAQNFGNFRVPPQVVLDAASAKFDLKNYPIWFSLAASNELEGDALPLPQISASYLRIKDGSIPVSFIQKYLKRKLDLTNDVEVNIKCMGQTVIPTLTLNNLVDLWLQTTSTERVKTTLGSSAKDFVMVLGYACRAPDS